MHHFVGPTLHFDWGKVWWSLGVYANCNDITTPQVGESYGPVWVRTLLGLNLSPRARLLCAALLGALAAACTPASAPDAPPIAAVHSSKCGRCHSPPEPSSHSRAQLAEAFGRHKSRVHLSQDEWQAMIDYLASPAN